MGKKKDKPRTTAFVAIRGVTTDDEWVAFARMQLTTGELTTERLKQLKKYSHEHDDEHSLEDWARILADRVETLELNTDSKKLTRKLLTQIGALTIAALEAMERKEAKRARKR